MALPRAKRTQLRFLYSFESGLKIMEGVRKSHGSALDKLYAVYGGSDRAAAVLYCTNQIRWRKFKETLHLIEDLPTVPIENLKREILSRFIKEQLIENQNYRDQDKNRAKARQERRDRHRFRG